MTGTMTFLLEHDDFEVELEAQFSISGSYQPATWGYSGGSPEEWPEFEVTAVLMEDGTEVPWPWLFGGEGWDPPWKLDLAKLEDECAEKYEPEEPDYG